MSGYAGTERSVRAYRFRFVCMRISIDISTELVVRTNTCVLHIKVFPMAHDWNKFAVPNQK